MITPTQTTITTYRKRLYRRNLGGLLLLLLLILLFLLTLKVGSYALSWPQFINILKGSDSERLLAHVILQIRLPRALAALVSGAALGCAGAAMQNVLRNPLASPFTLGVSQGAACGAAFAIIVLGAGLPTASCRLPAALAPYIIVLAAFGGALLTVAVLSLLAFFRDITPESLILAGVALSAFFGALTMLLQYFASDIEVAGTVFWTFGDLGKARWRDLAIITALLLPGLFYLWRRGWSFNALLWGDETASSLGIRVGRIRLATLIISALLSAVTIAFLGIIGFVGLIAPHLMRPLVGQDYRYLIPYSALAGAVLLLAADLSARTLMAPTVLPVGILTAFAGAPLFLYLLTRKGGQSR
ncbi:MAG: iron ABC transporter permease [Deltaproteobacteria bacterium]|nr:iron ABC transporter permease [Deltaproteobacteria bacterium]